MKYLIVAKPGGQPVPPENIVEAQKASQAYGNKLKEKGVFECMYAFYGGGGFAVVEADSHDDVYKYMLNYPMYTSFIWEVKPLLDWDKTFETGIGTLE